MRILLTLLFLLTLPAPASEQYGVMVWDSPCVHVIKETRVEAMMVNGEPDMKQSKVTALALDPTCGRIEIRKK